MKTSIRTKLVYYIFLTIVLSFLLFSLLMLQKEKKKWEAHHLDQMLSFASFTSPEIIKQFGRNVQSRQVKNPYINLVRELLKFNEDLIGFMILNKNGTVMYDSELYEDFLNDTERIEIAEMKSELDPDSFTSKAQNYRIVTLNNDRRIIDMVTPVIHLTGQHILSVRFFISYNSIDRTFAELRRDFYITIFTVLCMSFLMLVAISKKIMDPVSKLTAIVKKMRGGDFNARVKAHTDDEIGELSGAFNDMVTAIQVDREAIESKNKELINANVELKELQDQLLRSERLAAVGQLAAGISHEIDNPVGIILGFAEYIKSELGPDNSLNEELDNIINESKRTRRIVGGLLNFSKTSPSFNEDLYLNDVAKEVVDVVSVQGMFKSIELVGDYDNDIPTVLLDRDKIKQVLINLLINAAQSVEGEGTVTVSTKAVQKAEKTQVTLKIHDDGVGIPPENLKKIFNPFFTTKQKGKGTGLGLSICQKLINEQKGTMTVTSNVGEGTTFKIMFTV